MMTVQPGDQKKILVLRPGQVVTNEKLLSDVDVVVSDEILSVSKRQTQIDEAFDLIDLPGATLFPGFIDVHIHGAIGIDLLEADGSDLRRVSEFLATRGITGWMPTLVPGPQGQYKSAIAAIDAANEDSSSGAARILGVHYEGPFVSDRQCGALHTEYFRTYSNRQEIDSLPLPTRSHKRLITVAPEIDGGIELVLELKRRGWIVSLGHTRADWQKLEQAREAGARHMTHFMNAMAPLHHRCPGPIAWGLCNDDVTCDFIADGVHLDPVVLKMLVKLKGQDRLVLISDAIAAAGLGDGEYQIWGEKIAVENGRTSNAKGSIAGSVITMLEAVKMMLSLGAREVDVARMAATNPARLLGIADECGSIEEGKRADLVALDSSGDVALTIIGGAIAYQPRVE
jgi:N-acetylglucosamine-6-phosphate deacetylase